VNVRRAAITVHGTKEQRHTIGLIVIKGVVCMLVAYLLHVVDDHSCGKVIIWSVSLTAHCNKLPRRQTLTLALICAGSSVRACSKGNFVANLAGYLTASLGLLGAGHGWWHLLSGYAAMCIIAFAR
jgi:hypothetical protein